VDCPDIQHDTRALGDEVAHVLVIFGGGMRDRSGNGGRHPSKSFFDHCADVWKLRFVGHGGKTARAYYPVDFILRFLLDIREAGHGLNKADQCRRCGVRSCFEKSSLLIRWLAALVVP